MDLFDYAGANDEKMSSASGGISPLAERMKPKSLDDFVGQKKIMNDGPMLRRMIEQDRLTSLILYGPPGTGKTSLARVIASTTKAEYITINAVIAGIKDIKEAAARGEENLRLYRKKTVLFIDEIHRFNKLQQDALLPYIEKGSLILVGATTENPYFEINSALISRSIVCRLEKLAVQDIVRVLKNALTDERGLLTYSAEAADDVLESIALFADGDARRALNMLEAAVNLKYSLSGNIVIEKDDIFSVRKMTFASREDNHYDVISAFIKSMRGSDPDAAVYYLAVLIESGEDPMFIARRILICASEDVGNADPMALVVASAASNAVHQLGMPEARISLAQAAIYVATAPKSNAAYMAIDAALDDIGSGAPVEVPPYLRDGTSRSMELRHSLEKDVEYYKYPHDYEGGYVEQRYLPESLADRKYYAPKEIGGEAERVRRNRRKK